MWLQNSLAKAREIVSKMVMTAGMTDEASFWHRALALPVMPASFLGDAIIQLVRFQCVRVLELARTFLEPGSSLLLVLVLL